VSLNEVFSPDCAFVVVEDQVNAPVVLSNDTDLGTQLSIDLLGLNLQFMDHAVRNAKEFKDVLTLELAVRIIDDLGLLHVSWAWFEHNLEVSQDQTSSKLGAVQL